MIAARFGSALAALGAAALLAGTAPPSAVRAADAPGVAALIRESGAALGVRALSKIQTIHQAGAVTITGVNGTGDSWTDAHTGTYVQAADAGPAGGRQGFDGAHAWNEDPSGVVWDDGSLFARYSALDAAYVNAYRLWLPDRGGATVTALGAKSNGGHRYDVLQVAPKGSLPFELWLDATSHLPIRVVATIGLSTSTTTYADYRAVDGLRVPFSQISDTDGNVTTFAGRTAVANDPAAAAALRRPEQHVSDASLPGGTTTIPFELSDNHVDLPVTIDGKGPFRFIFDTGGQNIIDVDVAKQLGLNAAGSAAGSGVGAATQAFQFATVDALGVGGATLRKQAFAVGPVHAGFGVSAGTPVDGLIGFEVLARFVTTFDYGTKTVVLRSPGVAAPSPASQSATIPFAFNGQHPMIDCAIGGFTGSCVLDTGSRSALSVLSPFLAEHPSIVPPNATAVGANGFGVGGASYGRLGRTTVQLAGFTIPDVIADLSNSKEGAFADPFYAGNIGAGVLKRFAVTFDYAHETVTFVPNRGFALRETYERAGVFLIAQGGKIVVADVRPGTPAADAGLARGDILATVDGRDAPAQGLAAIRDRLAGAPGTVVHLHVVAKDGTGRDVSLTLRDFV